MILEERLQAIMKIVEVKRAVSVQELCSRLGTSESTIRRDLTLLGDRGLLIKVHGGATAIDVGYDTREDDVELRRKLYTEEKVRIAKYAASLVSKDDFVYLDAGTTTALMIDSLAERGARYVTNAAEHAKKLAQLGCTVYLLGGLYKAATEAIIGAEAIEDIMRYNFTKGFFGTNGIHPDAGFSTPDAEEALVKSQACRRCRERFILADTSKFQKISSVTFLGYDEASIITTELEDERYNEQPNVLEVDRLIPPSRLRK